MRFPKPWFFALLLSCWAPLAGQRVAQVPFELSDNLIFFQLHVNGSRALNFMFDSGAGVTVVNRKAAEGLGLTYAGTSQIGTSGRKIRSDSSPDNTLRIEEAFLEGIPLEVIGLDHLANYLRRPVDGIIGFDLFERYVIAIDADRQVLGIYASMDGVDTSGYTLVPSYRIDNNKIGIETSLGSLEGGELSYIMTLDTANPDALFLFPNALVADGIALKKGRKVVRGFSADTTITKNLRGKIRSVSFAGGEWKNVRTVLPTDPVTLASSSGGESFGLIGQELLLEFNMIYDYRNNRIYFQQREKG